MSKTALKRALLKLTCDAWPQTLSGLRPARSAHVTFVEVAHVESVLDLYREVRDRFPSATEKADAEHRRLTFEVDPEYAFLWFESLAKALNLDMAKGVPFKVHQPLITFFAKALSAGSDEVKECIDVSFVENLFWQVHTEKAQLYWQGLPRSLKELYIAFHRCGP